MIDKMRELTDRQMQDFVRVLEKRRVPLHSVLIAQHGKLIFEKYYAPYCRNKLQRMFSVTKSFTSLAIGLLEQEGKISLQDHICDYFPEFLPGVVHPWLAEMTIENMLKMQTCHNMTTYNKTSTTENWVRSFFQTEPTHRLEQRSEEYYQKMDELLRKKTRGQLRKQQKEERRPKVEKESTEIADKENTGREIKAEKKKRHFIF